jgi:hypothetical protein
LATERHENSETKKELAGSQKKIAELLTEVQDTGAYIAELEGSVRRSVTSYRDESSFSVLTSAITLFYLQLHNTAICSDPCA